MENVELLFNVLMVILPSIQQNHASLPVRADIIRIRLFRLVTHVFEVAHIVETPQHVSHVMTRSLYGMTIIVIYIVQCQEDTTQL